MKKILLTLSALMIATNMSATTEKAYATKTASFDLAMIMPNPEQESDFKKAPQEYQDGMEALMKELEKRSKPWQEKSNKYNKMVDEAKKKGSLASKEAKEKQQEELLTLQYELRMGQQQLQQFQQERLGALQGAFYEKAKKAAKQIRIAQGWDLIVIAFDADAKCDITENVISALNSDYNAKKAAAKKETVKKEVVKAK